MDCVAGGKSLGRSVLIRGNHAGRSELRPELAAAPLNAPPRSSWNLPVDLPAFTLNPLSLRVFNSLYFGRSSRVKSSVVLDYDRFLSPRYRQTVESDVRGSRFSPIPVCHSSRE